MVSAFHFTGPEPPRGAELSDLLQEVVVDVEEERELRSKAVHGKSGSYGSLDVGQPVIQGEGQFLHRSRSRLTDVIAADADGMPFRDLGGAVGDRIRDQAQRRPRWEQ